MGYLIEYSPDALNHLAYLKKRDQRVVVDGIERNLSHKPLRMSRNQKRMRPNLLADWELRLGNLRVYYLVRESPLNRVSVVAVGKKLGNRVFIAGEEIAL
jgi:mRNA-degrading endonuclease RelE of RelBE toxin-antitoxin system